jgi:hypothetical protein
MRVRLLEDGLPCYLYPTSPLDWMCVSDVWICADTDREESTNRPNPVDTGYPFDIFSQYGTRDAEHRE